MAAEPHSLVAGVSLVGVTVALAGPVLGPIYLAAGCAVFGAGVAIAMRGPVTPVQGLVHLGAGIVNAVAFVGIGASFASRLWGLDAADWLAPLSVGLGAVGHRYVVAFDLALAAWRKVRGVTP